MNRVTAKHIPGERVLITILSGEVVQVEAELSKADAIVFVDELDDALMAAIREEEARLAFGPDDKLLKG
jgi:hypothetical protein